MATHFLGSSTFLVPPLSSGVLICTVGFLIWRSCRLFQEEPFGSDALPFLDTGKPLSMTSEVMDSNFPFSDTADIANHR